MMTIDDVYQRKIDAARDNRKLPILLVSEEQRQALLMETRLLPQDRAYTISNPFTWHEKFTLFNVKITTEERERRT